MEVRDTILKFKHQNSPAISGIMTESVQRVGPALCRKMHGLTF